MRAVLIVVVLALAQAHASAAPRQIDDHHWEGIERIVAVGDLHGDFENYMAVLRAAGLVDERGRWSGGEAHLVQTGDIPDRGPDTKKIIEHMVRLARQADRRGGRVHNLMGNHEAMNVYGDLRYVTPDEFEAFATSRSERLRDRYFEMFMANLEERDPERFESLPDDFRQQWEAAHPPGWVEHRQAWNPRWNADGEMFEWVMATRVAIRLNDLVFVHGGISSVYCANSLESLTGQAREALRGDEPDDLGILVDELGPLWYRGLSGVTPEARPETVDAILEQHEARHIVVGHTPTGGVVWPRYDGKVIQIDTGLSAAYGGHVGYLEVTPDGLFAGYRSGRVPLPAGDDGRVAYLERVARMHPDNDSIAERLTRLKASSDRKPEPEDRAATDAAGEEPTDAAAGEPAEADDVRPAPAPICGRSG
ncbi:MAG: metallophosphoesterase [Wenzhouxiangellaceae bacterium]|nr:metallophosphoesterase [Wenzhouxiangellaceae bacterium]